MNEIYCIKANAYNGKTTFEMSIIDKDYAGLVCANLVMCSDVKDIIVTSGLTGEIIDEWVRD